MPDHPVDVRLVALDMDGTLLDADGRVPEGFWPLLDRMTRRGIVVVPASGRQYATLRGLFGEGASRMGFIAENGTLVAYRDEILSADTIAPEATADLVGAARAALAVLRREPARAARVVEVADHLAAVTGAATPRSAVVSVILGDPALAVAAAGTCLESGVRVGCFRPPSVPVGTARLRLTARADLSGADLARAGDVLRTVLAR